MTLVSSSNCLKTRRAFQIEIKPCHAKEADKQPQIYLRTQSRHDECTITQGLNHTSGQAKAYGLKL